MLTERVGLLGHTPFFILSLKGIVKYEMTTRKDTRSV